MKTIILMSIRPEWVAKILNGEKTEEIRKNIGELVPPFKVYAYVTKGKPYLQFNAYENQWELTKSNDKKRINPNIIQVNGKVCYEFVCDRVQEITSRKICGEWASYTETMSEFDLSQKSCVENKEIVRYLKGKNGYSLHISELKVYDTPKELGEFHKVGFNEAMKNWEWDRLSPPDEKSILIPCPAPRYEIKKAPQSWQFVEELK